MNQPHSVPSTRRSRRATLYLFAATAAGMSLSPVAAVFAAGPETSRVWSEVDKRTLAGGMVGRSIAGNRYRTLALDARELSSRLDQAPLEFTEHAATTEVILELPWPTGGFRRFRIEESPIMEPALAIQLPDVKTYRGWGIDDPAATTRLDWTPAGFHAIVLSPEGAVYIDPNSRGDIRNYRSYFQRDYQRTDGESFRCGLTNEAVTPRPDPGLTDIAPPVTNGAQIRLYRLALAATGEYTAYFGGTKGGAQSAMLTTMNRVNAIYEQDLSVRMLLINNTNLIHTDAANDPYANNDGAYMLCQNEVALDAQVGPANYDIGHVFSTGGGGVAGLGVVCNNYAGPALGCNSGSGSIKAAGVTGSSKPTGDAFDVDYVAHEMGHQFGGPHTFNGGSGACGGNNRNAATAYEPGSGSTIQAYAGICGAENLQAHSDPYFHASSLSDIISYVTNANPGFGGSCGTSGTTGYTPPTVNAGPNFTIPHSTWFTLTATTQDRYDEPRSYAWEQMDAGTPNFRSYNPTRSLERTFPRLSGILTGSLPFGEYPPTAQRTMNFRVTARNFRTGVAMSDTSVFAASTGPFRVTSPNTSASMNGNSAQTITWDVAGTNAAPINTANVNILISTDAGATFWKVLASNTPNDGSQVVTMPNVNVSGAARVKVAAAGNIYFDVSDANFSIVRQPSCALGSGDVDSDGVPDSVELLEAIDPCIMDNGIFVSNRLFVMQQYRDFLKREGDTNGIANLTDAVNAGTLRASMVKYFFDSAEFQGAIAPVTRLYFAYFNRIPDKFGLDYWIYQYRSGTPLNTISQAFAGSPEFVGTYGSLNNSQFVNLVYQNVLGRAPDSAGLAYWVGQLDGGLMTRGQVMVGFSESTEYQQTSYNRVFVTMTYYGMLVRMPDQAGFNYWIGQLAASASPIDIINAFLNADEYRARFLP